MTTHIYTSTQLTTRLSTEVSIPKRQFKRILIQLEASDNGHASTFVLRKGIRHFFTLRKIRSGNLKVKKLMNSLANWSFLRFISMIRMKQLPALTWAPMKSPILPFTLRKKKFCFYHFSLFRSLRFTKAQIKQLH